MAKEKLTENVTPEGYKRWKFYFAIVVVLAGILVGTLITLGTIDQDQVDAWVVAVVASITAFLGLAGTIRALLNPEKRDTGIAPPVGRDSVM